ncbi:MAG: site-specific DNA-methyltransferase [Gemmatimonadaceae bacterium]|jgi:adenine-specific DNA-methyltransferase|nr:site-specific DNA-methyltransferase [Gemmatimonadaceae bacterium]
MTRSQKLELTWVGKDDRPRLEPRILVEDPALSYHAPARVTPNDRFDNLLIQGDNLLALKALEQEYAGKVKCVFIDPPYNTGSAFEHYDDGVEHSLWLSLMRDRLEILRTLLSEDGSIWITIDDNEAHYLKVLCDEVFGRANFVANVIWQKNFAPKSSARHLSVSHDHVLLFAKAAVAWHRNLQPRSSNQDDRYKNADNDPRGPWISDQLTARNPYSRGIYSVVCPSGRVIDGPPKGRFWAISFERFRELDSDNRIWWGKKGDNMPRLKRFLTDVQQGVVPQTIWTHEEVGHTQEAKKELLAHSKAVDEVFMTPKPERLISRILEIATNPGDLVLDSFLGSGTTAAVAHKMGRRWIGIELGDHAVTHCVPRLRKVIDGADPAGVTAQTNWKGGGGFRFLRLAPSLLERDHWGNWVVSREYNATMLAEAVCKLHGFRYEPNPQVFWQHGRSTERDYLYVTTQTLDVRQLEWLNESVGPDRSLLVLCRAWLGSAEAWPNLSLKKLPNAVLGRCEFGRDDYSLRIAALPDAPVSAADDTESTTTQPEESGAPGQAQSRKAKAKAKKREAQSDPQTDLLAEGDA